jgi:hypothetical protein
MNQYRVICRWHGWDEMDFFTTAESGEAAIEKYKSMPAFASATDWRFEATVIRSRFWELQGADLVPSSCWSRLGFVA